jgi:hypothetical protein
MRVKHIGKLHHEPRVKIPRLDISSDKFTAGTSASSSTTTLNTDSSGGALCGSIEELQHSVVACARVQQRFVDHSVTSDTAWIQQSPIVQFRRVQHPLARGVRREGKKYKGVGRKELVAGGECDPLSRRGGTRLEYVVEHPTPGSTTGGHRR